MEVHEKETFVNMDVEEIINKNLEFVKTDLFVSWFIH